MNPSLYDVISQSNAWSPEICQALQQRGFSWFFELQKEIGEKDDNERGSRTFSQ